jgi:hypothetical protein
MRSPGYFLASVTRTRIGLAGAVLTTVTAIVFIALVGAELIGFHLGPYAGILAFIVVPALFVFGLLLIPVGMGLDRWRRKKAGEAGPPVIDLGSTGTRRKIRVFILLTLVNLLILMIAAFKGVHVMESNAFCGQACHSVMRPEFTAFQRSTHSRLDCVDCHVGEGVGSFVKAKLAGSWQMVSVALDLYPRPIPTPLHGMRKSSETCENCHQAGKYAGDRLKVISRFQEDEANTELKTVMTMKIGGTANGKSHGIHWHADPANVVRYRSDPTRETIYEIEKVKDGEVVERWSGPGNETPEAKLATEWRTMECTDCHNRPAHIYVPAEEELDRALAGGQLDRKLPFIRREGLKVLKQPYKSQEEARAWILRDLTAFYTKSFPGTSAQAVAAAAKTLADIHDANVFPEMKITWGTYKNQLGHVTDTGCLRCHNGDHKAKGGQVIFSDCDSCHAVVADGEADPEILKTLRP